MVGKRERLVQAVTVALVVALTACGGGGVGGTETETLVVSFAYPDSQGDMNAPLSVSPAIAGLQGHAPHCVANSGSLPSGMSLDSASCTISGTPTAAGLFDLLVTLTADGASGSVNANATITVTDPTPALAYAPGLLPVDAPVVALLYGQATTPRALVTTVARSYVAKAGDVVTYAIVAGTLPDGMNFDASSASIQGTPTGVGTAQVQIAATLLRSGVRYVTPPLTVSFQVQAASLHISYPAVCISAVATPFSCAPSPDDPSGFNGLTLTYTSNDLPDGITLDPSTGVLGGTPFSTIAFVLVDLDIHVVFPDGSALTTHAGAHVQIGGNFLDYNQVPTDFGVVTGPATSSNGIYGFQAVLTPGVPFGIDVNRTYVSVPGDVLSFALLPSDASTPIPSWLSIDPSTGHLFGVPPPGLAYAAWSVQLTTLRNGHTYVSSAPWVVTFAQ